MNAVVTVEDAATALRAIGGPWDRDKKRPEFLRSLAREVGLPLGAVKALFYRERKRVFAEEAAKLSARLAALQERRARLETSYAELAECADGRRCAPPADGIPEQPGSGGAPLLGM